jgi:antitoxin FitA
LIQAVGPADQAPKRRAAGLATVNADRERMVPAGAGSPGPVGGARGRCLRDAEREITMPAKEDALTHFVPRDSKEDAKATPQRRTRPRGRDPEEEVREEVPRHAVRVDGSAKPPLGRRLRQLFAGIGLDDDVPEIRGQPARPADRSP